LAEKEPRSEVFNVLNRVEQRTSNVQNRFQLWSDYMLWSGAAAVTACKARLGDQIFT
jgi:anti-sigma-K factor RskA